MDFDFFKYQGTGNDFVIFDARSQNLPLFSVRRLKDLCDRRFGIGADGVIIIREKTDVDFEMIYYNADGRPGSMCGNGGRCAVRFVHDHGLRKPKFSFVAADGPHEAEIDFDGLIRLKMSDVKSAECHAAYAVLNTGSPHYVEYAHDVRRANVPERGREIRYSKRFADDGINVNFVEKTGDYSIFVRTYERGVEDETLSCGTGVTASALMSAHNERGFNEIKVRTPGGDLRVEFDKKDDNNFSDIWLCGPAEMVFNGKVDLDS